MSVRESIGTIQYLNCKNCKRKPKKIRHGIKDLVPRQFHSKRAKTSKHCELKGLHAHLEGHYISSFVCFTDLGTRRTHTEHLLPKINQMSTEP